jgi:flavin-dependent dehydrogenase
VKTTNKGIFKGKIVVGCDGVSSVVAKTGGFWTKWFGNDARKWRERCAYCTEAHFKLPDREIDKRIGNTLHLFYERGLMGYHWIFPKKGILTVGTGCATIGMRKKPVSYFNDFTKGNPIAVRILEGAKLTGKVKGAYSPLSGTFTPTYGDGVLLAGDSVGMVGSVTGEGIYFAARAGIAAGEVAAEAALSDNVSASFLERYEKRWRREFGNLLEIQFKFLLETQNPLKAMGLYTEYIITHQKEAFPE